MPEKDKKDKGAEDGPVLGTGAKGDPDNPGRQLPSDQDRKRTPQPAVTPTPVPDPVPTPDKEA